MADAAVADNDDVDDVDDELSPTKIQHILYD